MKKAQFQALFCGIFTILVVLFVQRVKYTHRTNTLKLPVFICICCLYIFFCDKKKCQMAVRGETCPSSLNHALKAKSLKCKMPYNSQICWNWGKASRKGLKSRKIYITLKIEENIDRAWTWGYCECEFQSELAFLKQVLHDSFQEEEVLTKDFCFYLTTEKMFFLRLAWVNE